MPQNHEAADLTNSNVVDRLEGNVIGAIKFLFEAQQQGVNVVADTLRRAVMLALGTVSSSSSTEKFNMVHKFLHDLIGLLLSQTVLQLQSMVCLRHQPGRLFCSADRRGCTEG